MVPGKKNMPRSSTLKLSFLPRSCTKGIDYNESASPPVSPRIVTLPITGEKWGPQEKTDQDIPPFELHIENHILSLETRITELIQELMEMAKFHKSQIDELQEKFPKKLKDTWMTWLAIMNRKIRTWKSVLAVSWMNKKRKSVKYLKNL